MSLLLIRGCSMLDSCLTLIPAVIRPVFYVPKWLSDCFTCFFSHFLTSLIYTHIYPSIYSRFYTQSDFIMSCLCLICSNLFKWSRNLYQVLKFVLWAYTHVSYVFLVVVSISQSQYLKYTHVIYDMSKARVEVLRYKWYGTEPRKNISNSDNVSKHQQDSFSVSTDYEPFIFSLSNLITSVLIPGGIGIFLCSQGTCGTTGIMYGEK